MAARGRFGCHPPPPLAGMSLACRAGTLRSSMRMCEHVSKRTRARQRAGVCQTFCFLLVFFVFCSFSLFSLFWYPLVFVFCFVLFLFLRLVFCLPVPPAHRAQKNGSGLVHNRLDVLLALVLCVSSMVFRPCVIARSRRWWRLVSLTACFSRVCFGFSLSLVFSGLHAEISWLQITYRVSCVAFG